VLEEAGIENFRFHDLRHTCASWLVQKEVPLKTVQEILGHKSFMTTLRYAHLAPELRSEAVERIAGIGNGHILVTNEVKDGTTGMPLRKSLRGRKNGAPRGTRTHDPLIKNQLLYQLSYRRPRCGQTALWDRSL